MARQLGFEFKTWGGKRRRAGRKPAGAKAGVSHARRPALGTKHPVHVTVRMMPHVWNLRSRRSFEGVIAPALFAAARRFGMRVCVYSVMGNHIHVVAEAEDARALGRGMKGFGVRVAKGLNKMMSSKGRVLADRYHEHILRSPTETRHAVHYVLHNYRKHATERGENVSAAFRDPFSSFNLLVPLPEPRTFFLAQALGSA